MRMPVWYVRFFSFLVRRIVAPGFIFVGGLLAVINLRFLLPGATIDFNGQPTGDLFIRLVSVVMPAVVAAFGVALFRVKPLDPSGSWNA